MLSGRAAYPALVIMTDRSKSCITSLLGIVLVTFVTLLLLLRACGIWLPDILKGIIVVTATGDESHGCFAVAQLLTDDFYVTYFLALERDGSSHLFILDPDMDKLTTRNCWITIDSNKDLIEVLYQGNTWAVYDVSRESLVIEGKTAFDLTLAKDRYDVEYAKWEIENIRAAMHPSYCADLLSLDNSSAE